MLFSSELGKAGLSLLLFPRFECWFKFMGMVATTGFNTLCHSGAQATANVLPIVAWFQRLCPSDQMGVFWHIYTDLSYLVMPIAPSSSRSQQVKGLLRHIQAMAHAEQLQAIQTLFTKTNSSIASAYGALSPSTKLAFWYWLAELIAAEVVVSLPSSADCSQAAQDLLAAIEQLSISQQVAVLRAIASSLGIDQSTSRQVLATYSQ